MTKYDMYIAIMILFMILVLSPNPNKSFEGNSSHFEVTEFTLKVNNLNVLWRVCLKRGLKIKI